MNEQNERDVRASFQAALAEFGQMVSADLTLDDAGTCAFDMDEGDVTVHVRYLEGADTVILWATAGFLPPDRWAGLRAARLLMMNDLGVDTHGFTLGAEAGTGRLVAADRRPAETVDAAVHIAAWTKALVAAVRDVRDFLDNGLPLETEDLDPFEND